MADELEPRIRAEMKEARLGVAEVVERDHAVAGVEQVFAEDRAEIAGGAGQEDGRHTSASKPSGGGFGELSGGSIISN